MRTSLEYLNTATAAAGQQLARGGIAPIFEQLWKTDYISDDCNCVVIEYEFEQSVKFYSPLFVHFLSLHKCLIASLQIKKSIS